MSKLFVFDTTLRDGEQVPGCQLSQFEKIEVAKALETLGVDIIEAGFPMSSPGDFASVVSICENVKDPVICALTRSIEKDIEVAGEAIKKARRSRIHTGIGTSEYHIKYKFKSTQEQIIERAVKAVKYAKKYADEVEFYAEDAGRSNPEFLARVIEAVVKAGADVCNIPDTTGYCLPQQYGELIGYLVNNVPNIDKTILSTHCHNDLGLATANTLAGIQAGARQIEVTLNGVGERAGNTSLEEVVMAIQQHQQLNFETQINTKKIFRTSQLVSNLMNMPIQPNKAIVGKNAFAHSSGIHQDGILKNRETYEIINPVDVGIDMNAIVLTARSGRAALLHRIKALGYDMKQQRLNKLYDDFLIFADQKREEITDNDLLTLIGEKTHPEDKVQLEFMQIISSSSSHPTAIVHLKIHGKIHEATATGNGPVDAGIKAIQKIVGDKYSIHHFTLQGITSGSDDLSKATIELSNDNLNFRGFASSPDVVKSSLFAYIDALNKAV